MYTRPSDDGSQGRTCRVNKIVPGHGKGLPDPEGPDTPIVYPHREPGKCEFSGWSDRDLWRSDLGGRLRVEQFQVTFNRQRHGSLAASIRGVCRCRQKPTTVFQGQPQFESSVASSPHRCPVQFEDRLGFGLPVNKQVGSDVQWKCRQILVADSAEGQ